MIQFDELAASALCDAAIKAADRLTGHGKARQAAVDTAMKDFAGSYSRLFAEAAAIETQDRGRLTLALYSLAQSLLSAAQAAQQEKKRENDLTAWHGRQRERARTEKAGGVSGAIAVTQEWFDPSPSTTPVRSPEITTAFVARTRQRAPNGKAGDTSSAVPDHLNTFVTASRSANTQSHTDLGTLTKAWSRFVGSCGWVRVDTASFLGGFQSYLRENDQDVAWIDDVASAFAAAGSGHSLTNRTLSALCAFDPNSDTTLNAALGGNTPKLMKLLRDLSADELKELITVRPDLIRLFWTSPPDPATIAGWWVKLPQHEQSALVADVPVIIGNLPGIPYGVRSKANLNQLREDLAHKDSLTDGERSALEQLETARNQAKDSKTSTQLVEYYLAGDGGGHPLIALGYGDLDAAQKITWAVPGMAFSADDGLALTNWTQSASNLYTTQKRVDPTSTHAVVAFMGYDSPGVVGESMNFAAATGSTRVAAELDGNYDARVVESGAPPYVAVVAHSYGTTTTADALMKTTHPVASYTMVGSPGIDEFAVPSLDKLHVDSVTVPGQPGTHAAIYTTIAGGDKLAPFGTATSLGSRPNPNPSVVGVDIIGGSESFSSDAIDGLNGVNGHNPIGKGSTPSEFLDAQPSGGHGYFDKQTSSLENIAATSTGRVDHVHGALTPTVDQTVPRTY